MKRFNEIQNFKNVEVKTNYCALKSALYNVNGLIIKYKEAFAFPELAKVADEELVAAFKGIKTMKLTEKHEKERAAILACGRDIIISLREYMRTFTYDNDCINAAAKTARFQVGNFIKSKENLTINGGVEMLKRNRSVYEAIKNVEQNCQTKIDVKSFYRLQGDVLRLVKEKLDDYAFA